MVLGYTAVRRRTEGTDFDGATVWFEAGEFTEIFAGMPLILNSPTV